ncbi:MAG TPA: hypothetical protein VFN87_18340 [Solirubrobacteraceae bacterium]|nr:hypothetical protein [Solirubrobacteraceae bacterium]
MATFTVDTATLDALGTTLVGIHSEMQAMHGVVSGYEGLLGGSDLEGEVAHFASHWDYGIKQMTDGMAKVLARLQYAAATYGKSEQQIQNACYPGG